MKYNICYWEGSTMKITDLEQEAIRLQVDFSTQALSVSGSLGSPVS